ncbi:MAG TPA: hypothetical protein VHZ24_10555 [Pirellulales bacterium]|jgi:hypothetical protein|nr:hypothetical protein [Pirellulales bacterium]
MCKTFGRSVLAALLLVALPIASILAADQTNPAAKQPTAQANTGTSAQAAQQDSWRFRHHQNRWWYYQPNGQWVYWNGSQWMSPAMTRAPNNGYRRFSYDPDNQNDVNMTPGYGRAPMTGSAYNSRYSLPITPFKKADSKALNRNDY